MNIDIWGDKELTIYLDNVANQHKGEISKALGESARLLQKEAKDKFGTYQRGWPKLKRATVLAKARKRRKLSGSSSKALSGLANAFNELSGDDPLVLFGNLRDSIDYEILEKELTALVFSDVEYAAVHEYGYKNVPARSYLRLTLWDNESQILNIINSRVESLIGRG